ncbi:DUF4129 domain-containing transglutaminase family protein [Lottiidibacillus patelloidae]|uniref:DUF4129 domain-containing transglutaminase family protein n=1 Tax=Lottiidibacillus patelloidae TaxID=2670334 RepID=UPI001E3A5713|nr:transglutaminase domain-containing protein [Lottiidibacillus patelloidae]
MHNEEKKNSSSFLLFVLGFLLFLEWLRPLPEITETGHLGLFMMFSAYTFFLSYMQLPILVAFPVKLAMVLYVIHVLFYTGPLLEISWIGQFIDSLKANLLLCLQFNFTDLTSQFRTFLFLIVLWLVSYLMFYWIIHLRKITLFFVLTIIFIGVIDTFTFYNGKTAIFRALSMGFILLGALYIIRVREREGIIINTKKLMKSWITALVIVLLISTSVAHALPKYAPQWPDPIPFITSYSEDVEGTVKTNGTGVQKSGYGDNDSHLGGPFKFDHTPIFKANIKEIHYWRVESKDMYTGKGWQVSGDNVYYQLDDDKVKYQLYDNSVTTERLTATINVDDEVGFYYLLNPGQVTSIENSWDAKTTLQQNNGRFSFPKNGSNSYKNYKVNYDYPKFSIKALRYSDQEYSGEIKRKYLQLPENLPERVKQLAEDIVEGIESPYDKVVAIERYFGGNGFVYDNNRVAVPGADDDYVDQFLFETQRGYCDNYSTSMAILLRTLGIPTRWVKGFTQGKYDKTLGEGIRTYQVTNADAHSWVEVYFNGVGWVPFEPTRGFNNVFDFINDDESTNDPNEEEPTKEKEKDKEPEQEELLPEEDDTIAGGKGNGKGLQLSGLSNWFSGILLATLIILSFFAYMRRNKILINFTLWRYKNRKDDAAFYEAYAKLLKVLHRCGYERKSTDTLRAYAAYVDKRLNTTKLSELTLLYEKGIYHKQTETSIWVKSLPAYEAILKNVQIRL